MKKFRLINLALLAVAALALPADGGGRFAPQRLRFSDGLLTGSAGYIADQTLLLQEVVSTLDVYNQTPDPAVMALSEMTVRDVVRTPQAPKEFRVAADGVRGPNSSREYRLVNTPLQTYDLSTEFTMDWLEDALESDVRAEVDGAMQGDADLLEALFYSAMFTKRTAGSAGTAYDASFWNGETDVPFYKNNSFGSAHYHYLGINSTSLTPAIWEDTKHDVQEHGYGLGEGELEAVFNSADVDLVYALADSNAASGILQAMTSMRERAIDRGLYNTGVMVRGVWIKVSDAVPSGYFSMYARNVKLMHRREHLNPAARGLRAIQGGVTNDKYPLAGMVLKRRIGFRPRLHGAATMRQIVASTSYTNPTFRAAALN